MTARLLATALIIALLTGGLTFSAVSSFDGPKWSALTKAGAKAFASGDFGSAERNFKDAIEEVKSAPQGDLRIAESFTNLGVLYVSRGQMAKAEPLFEKSVKIKEGALGSQDKDVIAALAKLTQYYLSNGKKEKTRPMLDRLAAYGETEAGQYREVELSFRKLSKYYKAHRKLEESEISVKQAETTTLSEMKDQAIETAVLLDGIALSLKDSALKEEAAQGKIVERMFKSALSLRERALPPDHAALAVSLENLGRLYLAQGRVAMAEPLLKRSYEISLHTLGPERRETQLRLEGLAQALLVQGRLSEAETLYRQLLDKTKPSVDTLSNFAALLVKQGKFGEAIPYYGKALKAQESISGPQSASLVGLLDSYAYALSRANRTAEAKKLQSRARAIKG